jgi:uncharacterized protein
MSRPYHIIISAAILAVGLIICFILISITWKQNSRANQTISVTGSAKQEISSDLGFLRGSFNIEAQTARQAYEELQRQRPILINYLVQKGFPAESITFFTINNYAMPEFTNNGQPTGRTLAYVYNQRMEVKSLDVNKIRETSLDIASLIEQGVYFNVESPEYHYTKLAGIKIDIQAEAARDAKTRAEKIAGATERKLGPLTGARMGVLQITSLNSNMISDYGINDLSSIEKEITGVVNATFLIE